MKFHLHLLMFLSALSATTFATPLERKLISADAKWLVHLDLDNLRSTEFGKFVTKRLIALADSTSSVKMDFSAIFQKVGSITAYGDQYETGPQSNGVLLIKMDTDTQKILEGFLAAQMLSDKEESIKKTQHESSVMYSIKDDLFVSIQPDHQAVLSKSQKQIHKAREVLSGKTPNLSSSKAFAGCPAAPNSFFFLGFAEAFNQKADMPPQAKILQMADGGRLVLGENADKLVLEVILKAKSPEVVKQIQQVVDGMTALISLSKTNNPELQQLINGVKVVTEKNLLLVKIDYPLAQALEKLREVIGADEREDGGKKKVKLEKESEQKAVGSSAVNKEAKP